MSDKLVKRFTVDGYGRQDICHDQEGEFVYYEDYAALLAERDADKKRIAELEQALSAAENNDIDARCHIAELEARTVKLPSLNPQMFNDDVMFGYRKAQREAVDFCAAAGISLKIEGSEHGCQQNFRGC